MDLNAERGHLGTILRGARTIAVVGLSPHPHRPSHEVAGYLQSAGYRIVPVRPEPLTILGERCWPDLVAATRGAGPFEVVNVFRRSEVLPALVPDLLAVRPALVWMQVGVRHEAAARQLSEAGITVVMDRCLMVEHPWLIQSDTG